MYSSVRLLWNELLLYLLPMPELLRLLRRLVRREEEQTCEESGRAWIFQSKSIR